LEEAAVDKAGGTAVDKTAEESVDVKTNYLKFYSSTIDLDFRVSLFFEIKLQSFVQEQLIFNLRWVASSFN